MATELPPLDEQTLQFLLQASKTPDGRSFLAARETVPSLLRLFSPTSSLRPPHHLLLPYLRILRNLCAGETRNQLSLVRSGGLDAIASIVLGGHSAPVDAVRVALQVMANVAVGGEEQRSAVWERLFPDGFREVAGIRDSGACDALCMILHTCCCSATNGDAEGVKGRLRDLCQPGGGLPAIAEIVKTSFAVDYHGDWLQLLLSKICFEGSCFPQLFLQLGSLDYSGSCTGSKSRNYYTLEQASLLSILSDTLSREPFKGIISDDFALFILRNLEEAVCIVDFTARGNSPLPTGSPIIDIIGFSLTILRDICSLDHSSSPVTMMNLVELLLSSGLCQFLLGLLRDLEAPLIIRKSYSCENNIGMPNPDTMSSKVCLYKGFRSDIVAVIGNSMFGRKHVQDEIRSQNGILLLLQQCVTDDENPFLREWGIWAMRCLLDENLENQKVVADLEIQGSVNAPEITELGLRVEIDQKNRRAKLVNVQPK